MNDKYKRSMYNEKIYMIIIVALICVIIFYNTMLGCIILFLYSGLLFYNIKNFNLKREEWNEIQEFSSKLDIASKNTLVKIPFPLVIIGEKGNIFWYNEKFHNILKDEEILGKDIRSIAKEINIRRILDERTNYFSYVKIKERFYDINAICVNIDEKNDTEEKVILLYIIDVTEKYMMIKNIEKNKESVMLIEVDNLDDVIKTTEEDKRPLLAAEIERTINSYAQSLNAMIKRYSNNKYVLTVQDKYITMEMDKKFDILDHIRDLNIGNKLSATLSVGVGINGDTPLENHKYAMSGIELALGRGGDQVVVKNKDKLDFYGGKTKEIEKRTKVRARVIAHALVDLIKESSNIIIMGHINPDVDSLGAAIGINRVVKLLDKDCSIVLDGVNSGIKTIYNKFKDNKEYSNTFVTSENVKKIIDENSLLILVDVHGIDYVQNPDIVKKCSRIVIIDHHRKGPNYISRNILSYIETYASSTAELVTEMLQYMVENPKLSIVEAEALLAGICVDTKNFYFKTGVRTFEAAAFLRKLGADTIEVKKNFSNDLDKYLQRAEIIKSAKVQNNIAIAICPKNIEDTIVAAQAADELLNITGIDASFVLVQVNNNIYISGRSLGDINVQLILEKLGGGGHITMAGAKINDTNIEVVCGLLQNEIEEYLKESER